MSHIGPQLPPHLSKRKRTPEDEDDDTGNSRRMRQSSPPSGPIAPEKMAVLGPNLPTEPARSVVGPTMPPNPNQNDEEIALDEDSDGEGNSDGDNLGPALPATSSSSRTPQPRIGPSMGPTMPPPQSQHNSGHRPSASPPRSTAPKANSGTVSASDSDSDSDYGPALPGTKGRSEKAAPYKEENGGEEKEDDGDDDNEEDDAQLYGISRPPAGPSGPDAPIQRDDWMLAPPTDDVGARAADPTKIRARKFATGRAAVAVEARAAGGGGAAASAIGSLWTETIEQKSRRLADTVLGRAPDPTRGRPVPSAQTTRSGGDFSAPSRRADAREAQIMAYTEATRGRSLYETHQESIKDGKRRGDKDRHEEKRDRERERDRDSGRHRDRESDRHHDKESDRHRDRHRDKHSSRHGDRHGDRHRERHRDRHRDSDSSSKRRQEEEDDPSARAFDREKDMSLGVQINHKQRRELLNRASDFGGRFQKGSYL